MKKLLLVFLLACGPTTKPPIGPGGLANWKGVPISDLENHPIMSTIPKTVEGAPGNEVWTYSDCQDVARASNYDNCYWITRTVQRCDMAGAIRQTRSCCISKFTIEKGIVVDYSMSGECS